MPQMGDMSSTFGLTVVLRRLYWAHEATIFEYDTIAHHPEDQQKGDIADSASMG